MSLENGTFIGFLAVLGLLMGLISIMTARTVSPKVNGFNEWTASMFSLSGAFFLYSLRDYGPDFFSVFLANSMMLGSATFALIAYYKFFNNLPPYKVITIALLIGLGGTSSTYLFFLPLTVIALSISISSSMLFVCQIYVIIKNADWQKNSLLWFPLVSLSLLIIVLACRIFAVLTGASNTTSISANSLIQLGFYMVMAFTVVSTGMGFIILVYEQQRKRIMNESKCDKLTGLPTQNAYKAD